MMLLQYGFSTKTTVQKASANVPTSILALLGGTPSALSEHQTIYMIMIQLVDRISVILTECSLIGYLISLLTVAH